MVLTCAIILAMNADGNSNSFGAQFEEGGQAEAGKSALKTVGWVSAALGAVALGLFVGRELRGRYKFNRRTPYDFYAHSGDDMNELEFGVGT